MRSFISLALYLALAAGLVIIIWAFAGQSPAAVSIVSVTAFAVVLWVVTEVPAWLRRRAIADLEARLPRSVVMTGLRDAQLADSLAELAPETKNTLVLPSRFVVSFDNEGMGIWVRTRAEKPTVAVPWAKIRSIQVGDPSPPITFGQAGHSRLRVVPAKGGSKTGLQFGVRDERSSPLLGRALHDAALKPLTLEAWARRKG